MGTHVDLDLFGVFRVTTETQRLTAVGADALLVGQFNEDLTDRKSGIIPPLRSGIARLLAPLSSRPPRIVLGVVQVIGTILQRRGLGASTEEVGLELAFLTLELFDLLFQLADAARGITMATLPIASLHTQLEVLALQVIDPAAQRGHVAAQIVQQRHPRGGGLLGATDLTQLAVHSQLDLPETNRIEQK